MTMTDEQMEATAPAEYTNWEKRVWRRGYEAASAPQPPATELSSGDKRLIPPVKPPAEAQAQGGGEVVWVDPDDLTDLRLVGDGVADLYVKPPGSEFVPLYTAPPSAPVGVEGLVVAARRLRDSARGMDDGNRWVPGAVFKQFSKAVTAALAQQPAAVDGRGPS